MTAEDPSAAALDESSASRRSHRALDWFNFFVADVQTGFGPFVAVYLGLHGWTTGAIGVALTIGSITGVVTQTPGGMLVDALKSKRALAAGGLALIGLGALVIAMFPHFTLVAAAEVAHGVASSVLRPAIAAITLGLVGHRSFSGRLGRNHRFKSLGNGLTALVMGLLGDFVATWLPFYLVAAICLPGLWMLAQIDPNEIDYARARSATLRGYRRKGHARYRDVAKNRTLLVFIGCFALFQFANASLVPLASARLGIEHARFSELITAGMVAVPQLGTALIATWVARLAETRGRKPLLLVGFVVVPIRAVLFALARTPWELIALQSLDAVSAAVIGVLAPLVVADAVRGSGRYNVALGALGTAVGIGAGLSTAASGFAVQGIGYTATFLVLAAVGALAMALLGWKLPETRKG